jgi:hypothetical protein
MGDDSNESVMHEPNDSLSRPQFDGSRYSNPDSFTEWESRNYLQFIKYKWNSRNAGGGGYPSDRTEVGRLRGFEKLFRNS